MQYNYQEHINLKYFSYHEPKNMGRSLSIKMVHEKCHTTGDTLQSNGLNLEEIKRKGCVTLSQVAVMKNDILNPFHQLLLLEKEIKSFILNKTKNNF